jgi:putative transposase
MKSQAAVERAYSAIARFYSNCKKSIPGKKGYPKFKKNCRSVEYKTSGWKLSPNRDLIDFIDKKGIGSSQAKRDVGFTLLPVRPDKTS